VDINEENILSIDNLALILFLFFNPLCGFHGIIPYKVGVINEEPKCLEYKVI